MNKVGRRGPAPNPLVRNNSHSNTLTAMLAQGKKENGMVEMDW